MIDKIWRIIIPPVVFAGINIVVRTVFSWHSVYENIKGVNGNMVEADEIFQEKTILIMLITMLITIPVMLIMMKKDEDMKVFKTFGQHYKQVSFQGFYLLIPLGITMCLGLTKLVTLIPIQDALKSYEETVSSYEESSMILRVLVLCILTPIAEELVYRGLLYKRLKEYNEKIIAGYISAIIFGVAHFNLIQGIYAFFAGIIFIYVYEKYRTIFAPVFLHMVVNTMALISSEFEIFYKINNLLLSKVFFMIIELLFMALMIRLIWKKRLFNSEKKYYNT